jgi:hypothetical protein
MPRGRIIFPILLTLAAGATPAPAAPRERARTADPGARPARPRADPLPSFALPDYEAPLRARPVDPSSVYLSERGEPLGLMHTNEMAAVLGWRTELEVIGEPTASGRVRTLLRTPRADIAVYVDAAALDLVARDDVLLRSDRAQRVGAGVDEPAVHLRAGSPLVLTLGRGERSAAVTALRALRDRAVEVTYGDGEIRASGFVSRGELGLTYHPSEPFAAGTATHRVRTPIALLDAPGGAPVAELLVGGSPFRAATTPGVAVAAIGEPRGDHTLVRFVGERAMAIGWVPTSALTELATDPAPSVGLVGSSFAIRTPGDDDDGGDGVLGAGTLLHDGPGGRIIGVTRAALPVTPPSGGSAWTELQIETPLGDIPVWVRAP